MVLAKRAECYLQLKRPNAAVRDCDAALELNADSAKALKTRGKAHRALGLWEQAAVDLGQGLRIDFDESSAEVLAVVVAKAAIVKKRRTDADIAEMERKMEQARQARAAAAAAASAGAGGGMGSMPAGMPPGMPPGMMEAVMKDPELMAAMTNPAMMAKLQACMSDPSKLTSMAASDPKLMNLINKLQGLSSGGGGRGGGMGGGMGGMGGGGGIGGGGGGGGGENMAGMDDLFSDDEGPPGLSDFGVPLRQTAKDDDDDGPPPLSEHGIPPKRSSGVNDVD